MKTAVANPERRPRCRYLTQGEHGDERCTAPALNPDEDLLLCVGHLAKALRQVSDAASVILKSEPTQVRPIRSLRPADRS